MIYLQFTFFIFWDLIPRLIDRCVTNNSIQLNVLGHSIFML
jgi:hypothetical protein